MSTLAIEPPRFFARIFGGMLVAAACCEAPVALAQAPVIEKGYAPVNGLRLYYEVHGAPNPAHPPLLLLHGGGSSIDTSFGTVIDAYARTRLVVAFDQQGHGRTADIADRPFSFERSAQDAVALLRYLKIPKADILGYSNGGHIALEIALKHPEVVRKLVIQSAMFDRSGSDPAFWESFKTAKIEQMPAELKDAYLAASPKPDLPSFFAKSVERMLHFEGWTETEVRSIPAPTLVLAGDRDVLTVEHAVRTFRLLPDAQLAILPNTDHMQIVNRSDVLPALVGRFLDSP